MAQDVIPDSVNNYFPEKLAGKHQKGLTALDLLQTRGDSYIKGQLMAQSMNQVSSWQPQLLSSSISWE